MGQTSYLGVCVHAVCTRCPFTARQTALDSTGGAREYSLTTFTGPATTYQLYLLPRWDRNCVLQRASFLVSDHRLVKGLTIQILMHRFQAGISADVEPTLLSDAPFSHVQHVSCTQAALDCIIVSSVRSPGSAGGLLLHYCHTL